MSRKSWTITKSGEIDHIAPWRDFWRWSLLAWVRYIHDQRDHKQIDVNLKSYLDGIVLICWFGAQNLQQNLNWSFCCVRSLEHPTMEIHMGLTLQNMLCCNWNRFYLAKGIIGLDRVLHFMDSNICEYIYLCCTIWFSYLHLTGYVPEKTIWIHVVQICGVSLLGEKYTSHVSSLILQSIKLVLCGVTCQLIGALLNIHHHGWDTHPYTHIQFRRHQPWSVQAEFLQRQTL